MAGRLYKSYNFIDKDPVIYEIRDIIEQQGISHSEIERRSGVTIKTLFQWFHGTTKRPQHATIRAVLRAAGYDYQIVKNGHNVVNLRERSRRVAK